MTTLYKNQYAVIGTHKNRTMECLVVVWTGFWRASDPRTTETLNQVLELIKRRKIEVLVSDYRKLESISEQIIHKMQKDWFPQAAKAGLIANVLLDANDFVSRLSLGCLYENVNLTTGILTPRVAQYHDAIKMADSLLNDLLIRHR